jgi:hypothetical protein
MNQILLSFLCGSAFIGGAVMTAWLIIMVKSAASKKDREELFGYWRESIAKHTEQIAIMQRIASSLEKRKEDA